MSAVPALEIQELSLAYGRRGVLSSLSLKVPQGSVYALLGRNGAGKSSLVRSLCGLEPCASGSIRLLGMDLLRQRVEALRRIGVVPERPEVPPGMTPVQAGRFCGSLCETWDGDAFEARLKRLGVPLTLPFGALSRGQQTQVAMGLALASKPGILILDDPTLGLDPEARQLFYRNLVEELESRPITVFLTTHDLQGVEGIADRVGLLQEGHLLLDEALESLKARFRKLQGPPSLSLELLASLGAWGPVQNAFGTEAILTRFSQARASEAGLDPTWLRGACLEDIFLATLNPEARP